ncbi:MAG: hypothetical protein BGO21_08585 [Dyadobacter sp. 50-39]|uniref:phosphoribosyltransferase-like protein n=1 Tax=Dyadobacter sp. 50-39 TaxID=1895756 RepID=UPI0009689802|nr:hypothetical protein [Dyadobacter sp. 50-39]OJV19303.1 MAG: hypothetical protein BGO21_08585 [Dyadobacter sp. 50-39]
MEQLITSIYHQLQDYRADEKNPNVHITPDSIITWIKQFDKAHQAPILLEVDKIMKARYLSKSRVTDFLSSLVDVFINDFKIKDPVDFLKNANFIDIQEPGKSQKLMLSLFDSIIQNKYGISLNECGSISKKYSIYIDDVLCTGSKMLNDTTKWLGQDFVKGKLNKEAINDGSTILIYAYVFIHNRNYYKKVKQMRHSSNEVANKHKMYRLVEIENEINTNSKIDIIHPIENGQPQIVIDYKNEITHLVDKHANEKKYRINPEEFYRPSNLPLKEELFTSPQNRIIVENAFLQKGIEIIKNTGTPTPNIRALGYSLPSLKDFGFGALCFTWRNIPNNTPLVFWGIGGGFNPLFKVKRGLSAEAMFAQFFNK